VTLPPAAGGAPARQTPTEETTVSDPPVIDPAVLKIFGGWLVQENGDGYYGGTLSLLMTVTELAELIQQGAPVLPEPDRWDPDGEGHFTPLWDTHDVVVAGGGAVIEGAFRGYREDLDNVERTALAILSAVRYARRYAGSGHLISVDGTEGDHHG